MVHYVRLVAWYTDGCFFTFQKYMSEWKGCVLFGVSPVPIPFLTFFYWDFLLRWLESPGVICCPYRSSITPATFRGYMYLFLVFGPCKNFFFFFFLLKGLVVTTTLQHYRLRCSHGYRYGLRFSRWLCPYSLFGCLSYSAVLYSRGLSFFFFFSLVMRVLTKSVRMKYFWCSLDVMIFSTKSMEDNSAQNPRPRVVSFISFFINGRASYCVLVFWSVSVNL